MATNNSRRTVIIQASSRSKGDTSIIVNHILQKTSFDFIDLKTKDIGHYDYNYKNKDDDFLPLIEEIVENYNTIIFVTPVYWYNMSGILKVFFDRISDLLRVHKPLGRQLRGKKMAAISCSNTDDLVDGFDMPFRESANYLGMDYLGHLHTWVDNGQINEIVLSRIDNFLKKVVS